MKLPNVSTIICYKLGVFVFFLLKYFVIWAESINFAGDYYPTLSKICASINISPERSCSVFC